MMLVYYFFVHLYNIFIDPTGCIRYHATFWGWGGHRSKLCSDISCRLSEFLRIIADVGLVPNVYPAI